MAQTEDAKLDDLKRLLRRLDKALPSVPAEGDARKQVAAGPVEGPQPASKGSALRTTILAGGVSLLVSLGVVAFLPQGIVPARRATVGDVPAVETAKTEMPRASEQAAVAPTPPASNEVQAAAVEAEPRPPAETQAASAEKPVEAEAARPDAAPAEEKSSSPVPAQEDRVAEATPTSAAAGEPETQVEPAPATVPEPPATEPTTAKTETAARPSGDNPALAALDASQFLQRGLAMLRNGSLGAAQLLLERAADLGNGEAAFTLATTYDGAPGAPRQGSLVQPNADLALRWYERAHELGVDEARKRLGELKADAGQAGVVR